MLSHHYSARSRAALKYLDPALLSKLGNLELVARCAVEGFFSGVHPSPFHGFSVEYSDHRSYEAGDELRFIDWKAFGRSDKLYVKQFRQETNVPVYILLDSSMSMTFRGRGPVTKLEYGSYLAAALAHLMLRQGDSVGLVLFNDRIAARLPARSRASHLHALLVMLQQNTARGTTRLADVLHTVAETIHRRGIVILISDLLDEVDDVAKGLAHLKHLRHDILLFHTLDHQEIHLDYDGLVEFDDLESRTRIRTYPASLQEQYRRNVAAYLDDLEQTAGRNGLDYTLMNTSEPLDRALMAYLSKRRRMQ